MTKRWFLAAVPLLAAVALRTAYLAALSETPGYRVPAVDAAYHDAWARGMALGDWCFSKQHDVAAMRDAPYFRPPGYPYYLAAVYRVFGTDPLWPRVGNMVMGLAAVLLLGAFAARAYGARVAWLAQLLAGCYWGLLYFEGELLEGPLLVLGAVGCLYGVLRAVEATGAARQFGWALAAGVAMGLHAISRPNILLAAPALALWLGWRVWRAQASHTKARRHEDRETRPDGDLNRQDAENAKGLEDRSGRHRQGLGGLSGFPRCAMRFVSSCLRVRSCRDVKAPVRPLAAMAALTLGTLLAVLPVTVRNRLVGGEWVLVSTNGGINLHIGNNDNANGLFVGTTAEFGNFGTSSVYEEILGGLAEAQGRPLSYREADRYFAAKATAWMRAHPWRVMALLGRKLVYLASAWETGHNRVIHYERRKLPVLRYLPGNWGVLLALCAAAAALGPGRGVSHEDAKTRRCEAHAGATVSGAGGLALLFVCAYALSFLPFFVTGQYRMPLVPWLCLGAAVGLDRLATAFGGRRWRAILYATGVAGVVYGVSAVNWLGFRPNLTKWHFDEGTAFEALNRPEAAIAAYRTAAGTHGQTGAAWYNLGRLEAACGRPQEAVRAYQQAIREGLPDRSQAWNNLGNLLLRLGRAEEAATALAEAVRRNPKYAEARSNYGTALLAAGNREAAREQFEQALALSGGALAYPCMQLGALAWQDGDRQRAESYFMRAVAIRPELAAAVARIREGR